MMSKEKLQTEQKEILFCTLKLLLIIRLKVTSRIKSLDKTNGDCERPSLTLPFSRRLIN